MGGNIEFFREERDVSELALQPVESIIEKITRDFGFVLHQLNIIFLSDEGLWQINLDYLSHDTYTDVITFDLNEGGKNLSGEVYLSVDRIIENAEHNKVPFWEELNRVIIHGVLHLVGFTDKIADDKVIMKEKEDKYLGKVKKGFKYG